MSRPLRLKRPPATGNPPQDNFNRTMQRKNLDMPLQAVLHCTAIKRAGEHAPRKTKKRARTAALRYREQVLHIPKWKQEMAENTTNTSRRTSPMSRRIRSPKPPVTGHPHADNDTRNAWDGETGGWVEIRQGEFMAAGEAYNDALDAASNTPGKE